VDSLTYSVRNFFAKAKAGASYRMSFIEGKIGINVEYPRRTRALTRKHRVDIHALSEKGYVVWLDLAFVLIKFS